MSEYALSQQKEAVRSFFAQHGTKLRGQIAEFDGIHHELKMKVDLISRVKPEGLAVWMAYVEELRGLTKEVEADLLDDFSTYIIAPSDGVFQRGENPYQTASEILGGFPDLLAALQRGETAVYAGYRFALPSLGAQIATIEPIFATMTYSAQFTNPYEERLKEISDWLEKNGYVPAMYLPDEDIRVVDSVQN